MGFVVKMESIAMWYCEGGRSVWISVEDGENKFLKKGIFQYMRKKRTK